VVKLVLDSGKSRTMIRGDVVIQPATLHQFINGGNTDWARIMFAMHDREPAGADGKNTAENLVNMLPDQI
jgi:hypothetical protein